ncbi:MAG: DUF547 domain-containing protein [Pseudomonadota bacterium]
MADEFDHSAWTELLGKHVVAIDDGNSTAVDYAGIGAERSALTAYLSRLATVSQTEFDGWSRDDQLAFLINVYNAWTVDLILQRYPDLESIRNLGSFFSSPWKKDFVALFGETVSLDHVEHTLIRGSGRYNDPRIHFAVNCASIGCPALANEAYTSESLDAQLDAATVRFLGDASRNRAVRNGDEVRLEVSSIFKWYRGDFEQGWRGTNSLGAFFARYAESLGLTDNETTKAAADDIAIRFLAYDWALNDTP